MIAILLGAMLLSAIHASLPNHWLTLVMLARAEKWSQQEALFITAIAGFTHTVSTVLIGFAVGLVGWKLPQAGEQGTSPGFFAPRTPLSLLALLHLSALATNKLVTEEAVALPARGCRLPHEGGLLLRGGPAR